MRFHSALPMISLAAGSSGDDASNLLQFRIDEDCGAAKCQPKTTTTTTCLDDGTVYTLADQGSNLCPTGYVAIMSKEDCKHGVEAGLPGVDQSTHKNAVSTPHYFDGRFPANANPEFPAGCYKNLNNRAPVHFNPVSIVDSGYSKVKFQPQLQRKICKANTLPPVGNPPPVGSTPAPPVLPTNTPGANMVIPQPVEPIAALGGEKCTNKKVRQIKSQRACKAKAIKRGHGYYQYMPRAKGSKLKGRCATAAVCENPQKTKRAWKIYKIDVKTPAPPPVLPPILPPVLPPATLAPNVITPPASQMGLCSLSGDPHIKTFDRSKHDRDFYNYGDYWVVKRDDIWVQARYWSTRPDGNSAVRVLAVSKPRVKGKVDSPVLIVNANPNSKVNANQNWELPQYYSHNVDGSRDSFSFAFAPDSEVVVDRAHGLLNVRLEMPRLAQGQSGHCGNFNGNKDDDVLDTDMVDKEDLLFAPHPTKWGVPSVEQCTPAKRTKGVNVCTAMYHAQDDDDPVDIAACVVDYCGAGEEVARMGLAFDLGFKNGKKGRWL